MEVHGDLVVGVDAGSDHDVDLGDLLGHGHDPGDVPAEADHRQVHDGVDPAGLQLPEAADRGLLGMLLVPLLGGLLDLRAEDEDVLVHEGLTQVGTLDPAQDGGDDRHRPSLH